MLSLRASAYLCFAGIVHALAYPSDSRSTISDLGLSILASHQYTVVTHSATSHHTNQTYHFKSIDDNTDESQAFRVNIVTTVRDHDPSIDGELGSRTATLAAFENGDIEAQAHPKIQWACTFTVGCYRAAKSFGGTVYAISQREAFAIAHTAGLWFENPDNWKFYLADKVIDQVFAVLVGSPASYVLQNTMQKQNDASNDKCKAEDVNAVKSAVEDALKRATVGICQGVVCYCVDSTCIQAHNSEGKTYTHVAVGTLPDGKKVEDEAFVQAINVVPPGGGPKQPLNC
jgi:hypothetical protein